MGAGVFRYWLLHYSKKRLHRALECVVCCDRLVWLTLLLCSTAEALAVAALVEEIRHGPSVELIQGNQHIQKVCIPRIHSCCMLLT